MTAEEFAALDKADDEGLSVEEQIAVLQRIVDAMREALRSPFIRVLEANGIPRRSVLFKHALRGAAIPLVTVVGIVGDEKRPNVYEEMKWIVRPGVYRPIAQHPPEQFSLAVRSGIEEAGLAHLTEKAVASVDGEAALGDIESMQKRLSPSLNYPRFRAVLLGAFSALAVLLAAVGLYGVLAQFVVQRTAEVGLRKAVGAQSGDIARLIAWTGGAPAITGLMIGFVLSFALTRYVQSLLYGITPTDPATFAVVALVVVLATISAMAVPTRRALRIDPMTALRSE